MSAPPPSNSRARELGDLLRARRERLQPCDVGLAEGERRRARGLRREEVALLAAVSPSYLAFLEQGREARPSRQVLDALADALRLAPAERAHLHELAHGGPPWVETAGWEVLAPGVAQLVERLDPCPTYVSGRCWDILAANRAARLLWTDWPALAPRERNVLWWMFAAPEARVVFVEWELEAAAQLARFRAATPRQRRGACVVAATRHRTTAVRREATSPPRARRARDAPRRAPGRGRPGAEDRHFRPCRGRPRPDRRAA
jgi:transcriptional regulator with XRE-family HTH domain